MGLTRNPYKELAKLLPQGPLRTVVDGAGTGFQYLPSTLVRDYVMPVPGMLVKNAVKAVDDAAEGKPLQFDPGVSAVELFGHSAQAARRTGQTEIADGLEFLLHHPVGKVLLSGAGEMALDPLTYVGIGAAKAAKAIDTPPLRGTAASEKPPLAKALQDEIRTTQSISDRKPPVVAGDAPKGYTGDAGNSLSSRIYTPTEYTGTVKVNGEIKDVSRRVYRRNDIDINYFDETTGLTNLERMQAGKPPIGTDGNPVELHHVLQQEAGSMAELRELTHQQYYSQLHGLVEDGASFRNNPVLNKQYNNFRYNYWKWRASLITGGK